jgi:chromosome segregation ATPase
LNILTKISVVVLLVLVLFATTVFVTQATVTANYKHYYEQQVTKANLAALAAAQANTVLVRMTNERDVVVKDYNTMAADRKRESEDLKTQLATAHRTNASLQTDITGVKALLSAVQGDLAQNNERTKILAEQNGKYRDDINKLTIEANRLNGVIAELTAQADRDRQVSRVLQERLVGLEEENRKLTDDLEKAKKGVVTAAGTADAAAGAEAKVTGTITTIRGDLASINVGSSQGVKQGMKLIVYRGGDIVSYLQVQMVDATQSAGIIVDKHKDVVVGDKVTSTLKQ